MNRETLPGNETAVGADLSCAPPIYRPTRTLLCILAILLILIIGPPTLILDIQVHSLKFIKEINHAAYHAPLQRLCPSCSCCSLLPGRAPSCCPQNASTSTAHEPG